MLSKSDLAKLLCIADHYSGFALLLTCLNCALRDESLLRPIAKNLYSIAAEQHGTTVSHVTCSIRNLIRIWWRRGDRSFWPNYSTSSKKPPGNREFICILVAYLQHEQNK